MSEFTNDARELVKDSWSEYTVLCEYYATLTGFFDFEVLSDDLEWMKTRLVGGPTTPIDDIQRYSNIKTHIKRFSKIVDMIRANYAKYEPFDLRKAFAPRIDNQRNQQYFWSDTKRSRYGFADETANISEVDQLFLEYDYAKENTKPEDFLLYLANPEFAFDQYFLHPVSNQNGSTKTVIHIFAIIQYYFDFIKIHRDEIQYDLDDFGFITNMNYDQFPPTLWRGVYSQFVNHWSTQTQTAPKTA